MVIYGISIACSLFFAYYMGRYLKETSCISEKENKELARKSVFQYTTIVIKKKDLFAFLSFLPLYIVSAIRYEVGTDYAGTYKYIYNYVYNGYFRLGITNESLYGILNRIAIIYSGSDYVGVFFLSSLIFCGFVFSAIKRQSVNCFYSVLFFIIGGYYFWSFNGVRQSLAMAIFLFALQFIESKNFVKYAMFILLAFGFHKIAIIYLGVYFVKSLRINLKFIIISPMVILLFSKSFLRLAMFLVGKISIFSIFFQRYFIGKRFDEYTEASLTHAFINISVLVLYIYIAFIYDQGQRKCNLWINIQFLATFFSSLANVLPLASRLGRLFSIAQILSMPYMLSLIENRKLKSILVICVTACFCLYTVITYFVLGYHDVIPYKTIFGR